MATTTDGLRKAILLLPFPEWRQVARLTLLKGMGINGAARRLRIGYVRCQRIERLAMEALAKLGHVDGRPPGGYDGMDGHNDSITPR